MKLTVSCQICGRVIQEVDNGLGDEFPFSADDVAMYSQSAICEVDGTANIVTIFTRELTADTIKIQLGHALAQLSDDEARIGVLESNVAQLEYEISQLPDAASLYDEVQQDQVLINDLQQQVQTQTNLAQTYASALTQQRSIAQRIAPLMDSMEYQVTSSSPNNSQVKAYTDEVQQLAFQINSVACDALQSDPPQPLGVWVNFPVDQYDNFQSYLAEQDPVIDPISSLDGENMTEMTQQQYAAWLQFLG